MKPDTTRRISQRLGWQIGSPRLIGAVAFTVPVVLLLILFAFGYASSSRELNEVADSQLESELVLARETVNDRLTHSLSHLEGHVETIAGTLNEGDQARVLQRMHEIRESDPELAFVALYTSDGRGVLIEPPIEGFVGETLDREHWYGDYLAQGRESTISDIYSPVVGTEDTVAAVAVPLAAGQDSLILLGALHLRSIESWLVPFRIGDNGGLILTDRHDAVIASSAVIGLGEGAVYSGECRNCLLRETRTFRNWKLYALLPRAEINRTLLDILLLPSFAGIGLIAVAGMVGLVVARLAGVARRQQDELVETRIQVERNFRDLEDGLLPRVVPVAGWEIWAKHASASSGARVGGDFFDVFEAPSGHPVIVVGDASGKGVHAAAMASTARMAARAFFQTESSPDAVLTALSRYLFGQIPDDAFVTMVVGIADRDHIHITSAGHPLPVVARPSSGAAVQAASGPIGVPLGVMEQAEYTTFTMVAEPNYTALFFTDGLIEARSPDGLYGVDRAVVRFGEAIGSGLAPEGISVAMLQAAVAWSQGHLLDDIAVITVRQST